MAEYQKLMNALRWQHLRELIATLEPKYFQRIQGVAIEDILSFERTLPAPLPMAYKEFLTLMGADKNFNAFGRAQHDFHFLSSRHPTNHYPSYLFRVAHDANNDLDNPIDLFIDLRMSEGYDAPLFEYEPYNQFRSEDVTRLTLSFMEFVTRQVLIRFIKFEEGRMCYWPAEFTDYLQRIGYASAIPLSQNLFYFTKLDNHVMIEIMNDCISYTESYVSFCGDVSGVKEELDFLLKKFYDSDF